MPPSIPDRWDMETEPTKNQNKRKLSGSTTPNSHGGKRGLKIPTVPPTTDTDGALCAATTAMRYACELVEGLADEYHTEEHIGPCLAKVVKALEQVCKAMGLLSKDRPPTPIVQQLKKKDASTTTDTPDSQTKTKELVTAKNNPTATKARPRRRKTGKNKSGIRTPKAKPPAQGNEVPPTDQPEQAENRPVELEEVPFTLVEKATKKPPAPRPDGIPNEVLAKTALLRPLSLLGVFNKCLAHTTFPERWKESRLVLLHKGPGKPPLEPSSYRPLSMLDSAGKLLKRLILTRLTSILTLLANDRRINTASGAAVRRRTPSPDFWRRPKAQPWAPSITETCASPYPWT
ncbi:unnamed protein product [Macrosiphum euphorbiae]|uniref:RNA-directed DNA polymerase from transposon X-element n=1 Tax=Macrosiphum euphorbiae TaxID=13131 RepID=A0AAV0XPI6_9HEMI|nr:unnamed protein product [Macrosiphum euphorbiae]